MTNSLEGAPRRSAIVAATAAATLFFATTAFAAKDKAYIKVRVSPGDSRLACSSMVSTWVRSSRFTVPEKYEGSHRCSRGFDPRPALRRLHNQSYDRRQARLPTSAIS